MDKNENDIIIGSNIRILRDKMGLTQDALATFLGITRELVAYYEIGQRSMPTVQLSKLANLFCVDEYDFYEDNPQQKKINMAFAFRAEELTSEDLNSIARFKKIVRNYLSMQNILSNE